MNTNRLSVYTNIKDALNEVDSFLKKHPDNFYRIGTGELTDSLSLDDITGLNLKLIPFFMRQKNVLLELKTKSNNIQNLLKFHPKGNILASWSLNPQIIIDKYENGSAALHDRLEAAKICKDNGYKIGFHLDPVILYPEWENQYNELIDTIFHYVEPAYVAWISIAGLRYTPKLKNIILERFKNTKLFLEETIRCRDGKYRYIRPIRVPVYRKLIKWINKHSSTVPVYFCMESPTVWKDVFGKLPFDIENLKGIFGAATRLFNV